MKVAVKFYWDETRQEKVKNGPSGSIACKAVLGREQRFVTYLICILIIPL